MNIHLTPVVEEDIVANSWLCLFKRPSDNLCLHFVINTIFFHSIYIQRFIFYYCYMNILWNIEG